MIQKARELESRPSILIYGDNRCGKTDLMSTIAELKEYSPAIIIDGELGGAVTIKALQPDLAICSFDPAKLIKNQLKGIVKEIREFAPGFIGVDGVSFMMNEMIGEIAGGGKPQFDDWRVLFDTTLQFIKDLRGITSNLAVTCLPDWIKNSEGVIKGVQPLLTGNKFPFHFNSLFNVITFMKIVEKKNMQTKEMEVKRIMKVKADGFSVIGSRFQTLTDIEDPTFSKIYAQLKGEHQNGGSR